jgi:hypothetical protein
MTTIEILSIVGSLSFLLLVASLIKKGRLREEYSIVWLLVNILLIYFSFFRNQLDVIAQYFGVFYAPALLFIIAIAGIFIFLLHLSVVVSKQHQQIKKMAQHIAQIEYELRLLQKEKKEDKV